ncbi:MAG: 4-hydroxy-tetrahydrodipicolinate synthase [Gammaproteobacteria bacterium]|nr:4-hydroxy-tetrahydrodipicolinate synthase [Gammaproteobacteria bacterium]
MFRGSIVALVTPMTEDGAIDFNGLKCLIDWHIENDTDAFVLLGSTGEGICLTEHERRDVLATALAHINGRKPVMAGTGASSTAQTIELTRQAMSEGVDACLVVAPAYNRPPQEGLYRHYAALAEAVPLPIILYNVPSRTACDLLPETVARLAKIANIVGIKDATGHLARLKEMQACCKDSLSYFSGDDPTALEFMMQGGRGVISITANIAPKWMHELCEAALQGEAEKAKIIDNKLADLHKLMCIEPNPIPVKWALSQLGFILPVLRLPLVPLSLAQQPRIAEALKILQ